MTQSNWQTESIRASVFIDSLSGTDDYDWWESLTGTVPVTKNSLPAQSQTQVIGKFAGGQLLLAIQRGRVDWLYGFDAQVTRKMPTVGDSKESFQLFVPLINKWLGSVTENNPISRLAFGAALFKQSDSIESAYSLVDKYLPSVQIDSKSRDFHFRINRPRDSKQAAHILLNRLCTWSVMQVQHFSIKTGDIGGSAVPAELGKAMDAVRLELDMSTAVQPNGRLPIDKINELFAELVELAQEIAEHGDIE